MSLVPGPYVVNVADAAAVHHERSGTLIRFEDPARPFAEVGVNIRLLQPGDVSSLFHAENAEEHFLVLSGRCLTIIGGEERELGPWDFLHVPPGVSHAIVGAGDGPCAVLMMGARHPDKRTFYPESEVAARHGASSPVPTESPAEAYTAWGGVGFTDVTVEWPPTP